MSAEREVRGLTFCRYLCFFEYISKNFFAVIGKSALISLLNFVILIELKRGEDFGDAFRHERSSYDAEDRIFRYGQWLSGGSLCHVE